MRNGLSTERHRQKLRTIGLLMLLALPMWANAQLKVDFPQGAKETYNVGDNVELVLTINAPAKTCLDGINQTRLFQSGIHIAKQTEWKELKKGVWQKVLTVTVTGNKKGNAVLTVMRKTDQQSFTEQIRFNYKP